MDKFLVMNLDVSNLNEDERFQLIHQLDINRSALKYLKNKLQNLSIKIDGKYEGNIIDLMNKGLLEGWCWQTTESAIVFLDDMDCIERGNLEFGAYKKYWHSWICFKFNNIFWIFDPCFQILIEKEIYYHIFEIEIAGLVTAKSVKDDLLYRINHRKKKSDIHPESYIAKLLAPSIFGKEKNETLIIGDNDVNSPMYRNNTGYIATFDNGKLNTLIAHYYRSFKMLF